MFIYSSGFVCFFLNGRFQTIFELDTKIMLDSYV